MTFSEAERLKRHWTDKYVAVSDGIAELRRFSGLTGMVKTVNMSGRALVQFDGPADIAWYDIDPSFLRIVDQPTPKSAGHAEAAPAAKPATAPAAAKPAVGGSPLDQIRKQAAPAAPAAAGAKPSPLDLIRKQGAAKPAEAAAPTPAAEPTSAAVAPAPAPAAAPQPAAPASSNDTRGLSPIEIIRRQAAKK
jgi:hypothetical protein